MGITGKFLWDPNLEKVKNVFFKKKVQITDWAYINIWIFILEKGDYIY